MNKESTGTLVINLLKSVLKENKEIKAELDQIKQRLKILEDAR